MLALFYKAESQTQDCSSKTFTGSIFDIRYPSNFPEYTLDMPYEVLLGYVALDTVCYFGNKCEFSDFMSRQEYNDTLKTMMKHYYHVVDWDPLKFMQSRFYRDTAMRITVRNVSEGLDNLIEKKSDNPYLDYILCRSDIIAHVIVTDTISWVNNSADENSWAKYGATVDCEILDPIKGRIIPEVIEPQPLNEKNKLPQLLGKTIADTGKTIVFDYCYGWQRKSNTGEHLTMKDSSGTPWIKKDHEYIVFLNLVSKCLDNNYIYFYLRTIDFSKSSAGFLYPIENGIIISPLDDFGFSTGLTVNEFKTALRNRINQIKNFTVE